MRKTYQGNLNIRVTGAGPYTKLMCDSYGVSQSPMAEHIRLTTGSPADPQGNVYPDCDLTPGAMKISSQGHYHANNGTVLIDPPYFTGGTIVDFQYNGGRDIEGSGIIGAWSDDGPEGGNVDWKYEILVTKIAIDTGAS